MALSPIDSAAQFLAAEARILERRLFERLFRGGDRRAVRDAVAAYRNPDGGFGHGLEPDGRTPTSQPAAVELALRVLDLADVFDEQLVGGACDWLAGTAPPGGGVGFVDGSVQGWPRAPWWEPTPVTVASVAMTGQIAGTLVRRQVEHPWVEAATEYLWGAIDHLEQPGPYDMIGVLRFLQFVADRQRAETAFDRVGPLLLEHNLVQLDPDAPGEVHFPLTFAPGPDWLARRLFDQPLIDRHLDHLQRSQQEDGGWTFNWLAWSPAAAREWRGIVTVEALTVLRENGRL